MPRRFAHALVVCGTGMLAGATRYVAARCQRLTVVARGAEAACRNMGLDAGAACPADWRARAAFLAAVSPRLGSPLPDLALIWMHASGERAALGLLEALAAAPVLIVHVRGSAAGDPRQGHEAIDALAARTASMRFARVLLGSRMLAEVARRWPTDEEISAGAIEAVESGRAVVVGHPRPA